MRLSLASIALSGWSVNREATRVLAGMGSGFLNCLVFPNGWIPSGVRVDGTGCPIRERSRDCVGHAYAALHIAKVKNTFAFFGHAQTYANKY